MADDLEQVDTVTTLYYVTVEGNKVTGTYDTLEEAVQNWGTASLRAVVDLTEEEYAEASEIAQGARRRG